MRTASIYITTFVLGFCYNIMYSDNIEENLRDSKILYVGVTIAVLLNVIDYIIELRKRINK